MTKEKVRQVLKIYRRKLASLGVAKADYPHGKLLNINQNYQQRGLWHCHAMLDKIEGFIKEDRMDKVFRWLGFVQGCLWMQRIYTLEDLTNHNRKDSK